MAVGVAVALFAAPRTDARAIADTSQMTVTSQLWRTQLRLVVSYRPQVDMFCQDEFFASEEPCLAYRRGQGLNGVSVFYRGRMIYDASPQGRFGFFHAVPLRALRAELGRCIAGPYIWIAEIYHPSLYTRRARSGRVRLRCAGPELIGRR